MNDPFVVYSESIRDLIFLSLPPPALCWRSFAGAIILQVAVHLPAFIWAPELHPQHSQVQTHNAKEGHSHLPAPRCSFIKDPLGSLPLPPPRFIKSQTHRLFQQKQS